MLAIKHAAHGACNKNTRRMAAGTTEHMTPAQMAGLFESTPQVGCIIAEHVDRDRSHFPGHCRPAPGAGWNRSADHRRCESLVPSHCFAAALQVVQGIERAVDRSSRFLRDNRALESAVPTTQQEPCFVALVRGWLNEA